MGNFVEILNDMCKGDRKTRKGKNFKGTYGVRRKRKQKKNFSSKNTQLGVADVSPTNITLVRKSNKISTPDNQDKGVEGEQFVNELALNAYLKYWCYPNPKDEEGDKKEICDLLIAFFDTAIIISVKNYNNNGDYEKYKIKVVEKSTNQLFGAERKLFKSNRNIKINHSDRGEFIFNPTDYTHVHRITVNVGEQFEKYEFIDTRENRGNINIFNKETFEVITKELDTITDLIEYLSIRQELFIQNADIEIHCSEKDLLAFYLMNNREFPEECFNGNFEEWSKSCNGKWDAYLKNRSVLLKKLADEKSYFIDDLIKNDVLRLEHGEKFAKELMTLSRFERRNIANNLYEMLQKYQGTENDFSRRHHIAENGTCFYMFTILQKKKVKMLMPC